MRRFGGIRPSLVAQTGCTLRGSPPQGKELFWIVSCDRMWLLLFNFDVGSWRFDERKSGFMAVRRACPLPDMSSLEHRRRLALAIRGFRDHVGKDSFHHACLLRPECCPSG